METKNWIPNKETYNKIQKLIPFVEFVASDSNSSLQNKEDAENIIQIIKNIDKPNIPKDWSIALNLIDDNILDNNLEGYYWKEWSIYFEFNKLSVTAKTHSMDDEMSYRENDFLYYYIVYFDEKFSTDRVLEDRATMDDFLKDALNYKQYITNSMNTVEIDSGVSIASN